MDRPNPIPIPIGSGDNPLQSRYSSFFLIDTPRQPSHEALRGIARQASKEAVIEAIKGSTLLSYIGHTVIDTKGRGFFIAGSHKWLITDKENQQTYPVRNNRFQLDIYDESPSRLEVVQRFYHKLMQGKPLDQALREAEIEVLRLYSGKRGEYELSGCILLGSYLNPTS